VSVELADNHDGSLELRVRATEDRVRLHTKSGTILVTMWAEADGTVRARFDDVETGATGYLQGNQTFVDFGGALGLEVSR